MTVGFEKLAEGQIRMPETPSQNPAGKVENRQSIKNEENHKFLFVSARQTTNGRKRRGSPTTKRAATQPVGAAETGLSLAGSRLKCGIFMTIGSNVRRPDGLVRGHIAFGPFPHLENVAVRHRAFSFR